jgi:hypothetical protein
MGLPTCRSPIFSCHYKNTCSYLFLVPELSPLSLCLSPIGQVLFHIRPLSLADHLADALICALYLLRGVIHTLFCLLREEMAIGKPSGSTDEADKDYRVPYPSHLRPRPRTRKKIDDVGELVLRGELDLNLVLSTNILHLDIGIQRQSNLTGGALE